MIRNIKAILSWPPLWPLLKRVRQIGRLILRRREQELLSDSTYSGLYPGAVYTGNGLTLGRQTLELVNWATMLRTVRSARNVVMGGVGTLPARLALVARDLMDNQGLEAVNLGVSWTASFTGYDVKKLIQVAHVSSPWELLKDGEHPTYMTRRASPHTIVAQHVATPTSDGGLQSQPERTVRLMREDPLIIEHLDLFSDDVKATIRRLEVHNCNLVTWESGGGTDPCHQYVRKLLERDLPIIRQYRIKVKPSRREKVARRNFRGSLAMHAAQYTPENTVFLLTKNDKVGSNSTDEAMVAGVLSYTATEPEHQEIDAGSQFLTQREQGDFVVMSNRVVPVLLNWVAMRFEKEMFEYRVERPPSLDGDSLTNIIREISDVVRQDDRAHHHVLLEGIFSDVDIERIRRSLDRFQMEGSVDLSVNRMFPSIRVNSCHDEHIANYLITDMIYGHRAFWHTARMLEPEGEIPNDITRDGLRQIALNIPELETAIRTKEAVDHFLAVHR